MQEIESLRRRIAANETWMSTTNAMITVGLIVTATLALPALLAGSAALGAGLALFGLTTALVGAGVSFAKNHSNANLRASLHVAEKGVSEKGVSERKIGISEPPARLPNAFGTALAGDAAEPESTTWRDLVTRQVAPTLGTSR